MPHSARSARRPLFLAVALFGLLGPATVAGCSAGGESVGEGDADLTSISARQRILTFQGVVYVDLDSRDDAILTAARNQSRTAFGALLHQNVAAQTREFQNVDPSSFKKRNVTVVDVAKPNDPGRPMVEVRYLYQDNALVPIEMAQKTSLSLALLGRGADAKGKEVLELCTANDADAKTDFPDLLWYDFDPHKASCRHEMDKEQATIDDETDKLAELATMVTASRVNRTYVPTTMQLARADTADHATFPEYDRLFSGASQPGVLTITFIAGRLAHKAVEARKDDGYHEWLSTLDVLFTDHPDFALTKIEPDENLSTISAEGRKFTNLKFTDFINWNIRRSGFPAGMPTSSRDNIQKTVAGKLDNHWVTFEKKVKVAIGGAPAKDLTIRLETLFGAGEDPTPHKRAIKRGDIFLYNGHSYIGQGPLDPSNFTAPDFSGGYQIFWFDSCVSYNYYEKDFFTLKQNGSKDLELITNGIEAPEDDSGLAEGKLISKLIGGSNPSYQTLLTAAKETDSLRVVDGEIDNQWSPSKTPIHLVR